ncbi:MAG TPA: extensin family protein, partial [Telmatospirillum sp.]|nr:extensin family protein [Telmatospirillum sp.]
GRPERLSQHAFGRALDVTGFELADGTVISVMKDWRNRGAKSEFLHQVAQGACKMFSVVLTPNYNAEHHDHLHLDIGPHKLCGT